MRLQKSTTPRDAPFEPSHDIAWFRTHRATPTRSRCGELSHSRYVVMCSSIAAMRRAVSVKYSISSTEIDRFSTVRSR